MDKKHTIITTGIAALGLALCAQSASAQSLSDAKFTPVEVNENGCGADEKLAVLKQLQSTNKLESFQEKAKAEAKIYEEYSYCGAASPNSKKPWYMRYFYQAAGTCGAKVRHLGSLFFEDMPCCGYDPQRRLFACPVRIKKQFGFGQAAYPGSRERVLHCVQDDWGVYRPVGHDSVHLANSNHRPTWQFAVVASAHENLHLVQPTNGRTRRARSILSWALTPTSCDYKPIWGNVIEYNIRLDQ